MPAPTIGLQTKAYFDKETSDGGGFTDTGGDVSKLFSDVVRSVRLRATSNRQQEYDIGSRDAITLIEGTKEYEIVVAFLWQVNVNLYNTTPNAGIIYDAIKGTLTAAGRLDTYALDIRTAKDATVKAFYVFKGCKVSEISAEAELNGPWVISITFKPTKMVTATAAASYSNRTLQTSVAGAYFKYAGAAIQRPSGTSIAYSTKKIAFSVANNLEALPDAGVDEMLSQAEGRRDIRVSPDITIDDGGKPWLDALKAGTQADTVVKIDAAATTPKITFKNTDLPDFDLELDNQKSIIDGALSLRCTGGVTLAVN